MSKKKKKWGEASLADDNVLCFMYFLAEASTDVDN